MEKIVPKITNMVSFGTSLAILGPVHTFEHNGYVCVSKSRF